MDSKLAKIYYSPRATGKASLPSKKWQKPQKCLKMLSSCGSSSRLSGGSIFPLRDTFLAQILTW